MCPPASHLHVQQQQQASPVKLLVKLIDCLFKGGILSEESLLTTDLWMNVVDQVVSCASLQMNWPMTNDKQNQNAKQRER